MRFCPACGLPGKPGACPFRCLGCGLTLYFNMASAVAGFFRREDGRWLFIRRALQPGRGLLAPVGGFINFGESAEDALRREAVEEVGMRMVALKFVGTFPNNYHFQEINYQVLDIFFWGEVVPGEKATLSEEVADLHWYDLGEVTPEALAFESMQHAWRRVLEFHRRAPGVDGMAAGVHNPLWCCE